MTTIEARNETSSAIENAKQIFSPTKFGFTRRGLGWVKEFDKSGEEIIITHIGRNSPSVLRMVSDLQKRIWRERQGDGFISSHKLSTAEDSGGAIFAAYPSKNGTEGGIKAFLYGVGGQDRYLSEMLGVSEDARGEDLGWYMKLIQINHAIERGQSTIYWTYDPLRGPNAILNIEKLGGEVEIYYHDRYGTWDSEFNGDLPTPRFGVKLDLISPAVQRRIQEVYNGTYIKPSIQDIADRDEYPIVTASNVEDFKTLPRMIYAIPEDVNKLTPEERREWVISSQKVFSTLLDTEIPIENQEHPEFSDTKKGKGSYKITNVVTGMEDDNDGNFVRKTYYVISRKDNS